MFQEEKRIQRMLLAMWLIKNTLMYLCYFFNKKRKTFDNNIDELLRKVQAIIFICRQMSQVRPWQNLNLEFLLDEWISKAYLVYSSLDRQINLKLIQRVSMCQ